MLTVQVTCPVGSQHHLALTCLLGELSQGSIELPFLPCDALCPWQPAVNHGGSSFLDVLMRKTP